MVPAAAGVGLSQRGRILLETATWAACVGLLLWFMRAALFLGTGSLTHDHLYWGYPVFQFYAESLLAGRLPLWNPFTHGGEPFYPLLLQIRLLDPSTLLVVFGGGLFTHDVVALYAWDRLLRGLIFAAGSWLLLRRWAREPATTVALVPILVLSSFYWSTLQQMGVGDQFLYAPWVALFLFRILEGDGRWSNWIALATFFGLNLQSYFFSGTALLVALALAGVAAFRRDLLRPLLATPRRGGKVVAAAVVVAALGMPNAVLLMESGKFVFPARIVSEVYSGQPPRGLQPLHEPLMAREREADVRYTFTSDYLSWLDANTPDAAPHDPEIRARYTRETGRGAQRGDPLNRASDAARRPSVRVGHVEQVRGLGLPYGFVYHTGTFSSVWDFVQLLAPSGHWVYRNGTGNYWGRPSEVFMYVGAVPYALALLGLVAGAHPLKRVWMVIGAGFAATMLGPEGAVHALLFFVFPPLWFVRHTSAFALFFLLALLYFFVLGADLLVSSAGHRADVSAGPAERPRRARVRVAVLAVVVTAATAGIVITLTSLPYPFRFYLFPLVLLLGGVVWLSRRLLPPGWLFASLLVTHVALVLGFAILNGDRLAGAQLTVALALPAVVWWGMRSAGGTAVVGAALVLVVAADLTHYSWTFAHLARGPRPDTSLGFTAGQRAPEFPNSRRVFAAYPNPNPFHQPVRYESILFRQPTVFTALLMDETRRRLDGDPLHRIAVGLAAPRTNSFLTLRGYFDLVRTASTAGIAAAFAVDQPLVRYYELYDVTPRRPFLHALRETPGDRLAAWLRHAVVLEPPAQGLPAGIERLPFPDGGPVDRAAGAAHLTVTGYDYTSLVVDVQTDAPGLVYWADGNDGYWQARLDGQPVAVNRANLNFKAVGVPPGRHQIRFVYAPRPFLAAVALFYATIAVAGAAAAIAAVSRRVVGPAVAVSVSRA